MSIHLRTLLILLGSFLSLILFFSAFVYLSVTGFSDRDFDLLLERRLQAVASGTLGVGDNPSAVDDDFDQLSNEKDFLFRSTDPGGTEGMAARTGAPARFFRTILQQGAADHKAGKRQYKGLLVRQPGGDMIAVASAENYYTNHHILHLRKNLLIAATLAFILALSISLYFSTTMFKPLHDISEKVRQIGTENLHMRIQLDQGSKELRELASTFNYMLDRIETSFETQNNFISNASHELRTPLTAIIGEADVALSKLRRPEEYIETIQVILEEAGHLERKTKALLFLAQAGFKGGREQFGKVRMDQLLYEVKNTVERVNPKYKVQLDMSLLPENPMRLKVLGNEQLLHLALSNIISNGCKYSDGQPVTVSLGTSKDKVIVVVKDRGIGISPSDLVHIYDPFFRGANTGGYEGYGIGLPLAQKIIRMHHGDLAVSSIEKVGTTVQVGLPIGRFSA
jgi:signal transduction histidine kinase